MSREQCIASDIYKTNLQIDVQEVSFHRDAELQGINSSDSFNLLLDAITSKSDQFIPDALKPSYASYYTLLCDYEKIKQELEVKYGLAQVVTFGQKCRQILKEETKKEYVKRVNAGRIVNIVDSEDEEEDEEEIVAKAVDSIGKLKTFCY